MLLAQYIPPLPSTITDNFNKFNETLSSKFYDGTNYITSLGDRVSSVIQPVDGSEEREVTRTPPNDNLCENVITLNDERIELVNNLLNLYSGSPTKECFKYYDDNVTFEDPLLYTTGLSNLKAQFYGTSKIPVKSSIIEYKILENTLSVLRISLTQKFLLPFISRAFVLESEIILEFNENKKICKHRDLWYGNQPIVKGEILRNWAAKIITTFATFAKVPESE